MRIIHSIILLFILFVTPELSAQPINFLVKPETFNSGIFDEFSPVFFKGGIAFCSNQPGNSIINYGDKQNRVFKIFYVTKKDSTKWDRPQIFANEISTDVNDGPVTFNQKGNEMYYSRNNSANNRFKNNIDSSNKLGIYSAELLNGKWTNIKSFKYNNSLYTYCTPALSSDGERIYFSSDMPGGIGGMDLYYCEKRNNDWSNPVNMGSIVNSTKNESFPFASKSGKLFFASDGHNSFGGKDIFYTQEVDGQWTIPVHPDSSINSKFDDFGLVTDSAFSHGYFSTNRRRTDDIFSFSSIIIKFENSDSLKENNFCFTFYDERQITDTIQLVYKWDFGNDIVRIGPEVNHCFPGPGQYIVKLSIVDKLTGEYLVSQVNYDVDLVEIEQAYINSYNIGIVNKPISFDASKTNLKEFSITDYFWDFGEGFTRGDSVLNYKFRKKGEYLVKLGLYSKIDGSGIIPKKSVTKKIKIFDTCQELVLQNESNERKNNSDIIHCKKLQTRIYMMDDLNEQQKLKIEEVLKESNKFGIRFDQFGITNTSYLLLDKIARLIKSDPNLHLEIAVHALKEEFNEYSIENSEIWAQELSFYFKNKEIENHAFSVKGFGVSQPVLKSYIPEDSTSDGVIELMFMKTKNEVN